MLQRRPWSGFWLSVFPTQPVVLRKKSHRNGLTHQTTRSLLNLHARQTLGDHEVSSEVTSKRPFRNTICSNFHRNAPRENHDEASDSRCHPVRRRDCHCCSLS